MLFNVSPDLFIGSQELNRLIQFLDDDGFRKLLLQNSLSFGIVYGAAADGAWDNFRVQLGTNVGTVKVADGIAIDQNGQLIIYPATDNLTVTNDNQWYWLTIVHQFDEREANLCSVDSAGNLTMPGGGLSAVLRGLPNNPVVVSFPGAALNTQEYEVNEVTSDTVAVLAGDFQAESNLRLAVVGSFTPGVTVSTDDKFPYRYDACDLAFTLESVLDTPPALTAGEQFTIARVKRNGGTVVIQDKRTSVYQTRATFDLRSLTAATSPLIGVEAVKWNAQATPRDQNLAYVAWGFRSSNWTIDSSANRLTLIAGQGGVFKDTSYFTDGDFDGWRVYAKDGSYSVVRQSSLSATQINLLLDTLDPDKYADTAQELLVVPDCDEVELLLVAAPGDGIDLVERRVAFHVATGVGLVPLVAYQPISSYNFKYRYKAFKVWTAWTPVPSDAVGYFPEANFDDNGAQIGSTPVPYVSDPDDGFITVTQAANAYANRIASVETGDLFGVEYLAIDNDNPVRDFVAGTRKARVVMTNDDDLAASDADFGPPYVFTVDQYFNFKTDLPLTLKNGNSFKVQFRGAYDPDTFALRFTQDYVNSGNPGTVFYEFTTDDYDAAAADGVIFEVIFDGTRWFAKRYVNPATITPPLSAIQFIIDGGGATIGTGEKGHVEVPFDCTVVGWSIFADNAAGSCVIDVWKTTYAGFPPSGGNSITGSDKPTLSAVQKNQSTALTGWTTALAKGDVLAFNVDSLTTKQRVTVVLKVQKTS